MGMYTEIHFNSEMRDDIPTEVVGVLKYMVGEIDMPKVLPEHDFFQCGRWAMLFRCDSYYFDADTHSELRWDEISESYYLCVRSNLKNYDSEIEKFIDWIDPYLAKYSGDFLGFYRYEETEVPTLIYKK